MIKKAAKNRTTPKPGVVSSLAASSTQLTPTMRSGDLAQTSIGSNIMFTGGTTTGSNLITALSSTQGLVIGTVVTGTGIPTGTTITALSLTQATLSASATATGTLVSFSLGGEQQVIGLSEWTLNVKAKMLDATTTDNAAFSSSIPSTVDWDVSAKFMFIDGDPSQQAAVLSMITTRKPQLWNFFPSIAAGYASFQGNAFVESISMSAGVGKIVGLDVKLKGTGPIYQLPQAASVANPTTLTGTEAEN